MIQHIRKMEWSRRVQIFGIFLMLVGGVVLGSQTMITDPAAYADGFWKSIKVVGPIFSGVLLLPIGFSAFMVYGYWRGLRVGRAVERDRDGLQTYGTLGGVLFVFAILGMLPLFLLP